MVNNENQQGKELKKWEEAEIRVVKLDLSDVVMASGSCGYCNNPASTTQYYENNSEQQ